MPVSSAFVTAMMNDASDGVIDGKAAGAQVAMGAGMMQADAGSTGLAGAMTDFMNSSLNRSGVAAANMAPLLQQLRTAGGHMH